MNTTTASTRSMSRLVLTLALALVIGLMLTHSAEAKPARGVSVGDRVQAQKDLCFVSGGTFESKDYYGSYTNGHQLQKTVTTCTGGKNPQTCTNTKSDTTCSQGLVVAPKDPLDHSRVDKGQIGGMQTAPEPQIVVDDGSVGEGQIQPLSPGDIVSGSTRVEFDRQPLATESFTIEPLP